MNDQQILENLAHKGREALRYLETDIAEQVFKDALELEEKFLDGWVGLGQVYYEMGRLQAAAEAFARGLKLADKQVAGWRKKRLAWQTENHRPILRLVHGLGLLSYRRGKVNEAKKWFKLESSLDPSLEAPQSMLADIEAGNKYNKLKFQHLDI